MVDLKQYHSLWNDTWKLFRKYCEAVPLSDAQWRSFVDESAALVEDHKEHDTLAIKLMIAISDEVDRIDKEAKA